MAGVNKVILVGNLGKDPEIRNLEGGAKVASFSLATNRIYRGQDGKRMEETEWHNIVLWRNLAELSEKYLRRGSQVYIEGRIQTRQWTDKEGNKRYTTEIVAENMTFLGGRDDNRQESPQAGGMDVSGDYEGPGQTPAEDDDLPF